MVAFRFRRFVILLFRVDYSFLLGLPLVLLVQIHHEFVSHRRALRISGRAVVQAIRTKAPLEEVIFRQVVAFKMFVCRIVFCRSVFFMAVSLSKIFVFMAGATENPDAFRERAGMRLPW